MPFWDVLDYCAQGLMNSILKSRMARDHVAELCMLVHHDVDGDLWVKAETNAEGRKIRKTLDLLTNRVARDSDERAAKIIYSIATEATYEVMNMYLRHRALFERIAPRRKLLPCLQSIHPRTANVASEMLRDARLGEQTEDKLRIRSKPWFMSDAPPTVYARAIILSVELNERLESPETQEQHWKPYDREYRLKTCVSPFPNYIRGIDKLPKPISPASVLDYWRKGKEIILYDMPNFHERPEWKNYRGRRYVHGAKKGAIQHAIFKDILIALRTIAGANKRAN